MTPLSRAYVSPYCYSIVTMSVSRIVSEIFGVNEWRGFEILVRGCSRSMKITSSEKPHLIFGHCRPKYSSVLYHFWVIWRCVISWPWNLGYRSLKVIQNVIRKLKYCFLFAFHSNYGSVLYHFRDEVKYCSKIMLFHTPLHLTPPLVDRRQSTAILFDMETLEWCGYVRVLPYYLIWTN